MRTKELKHWSQRDKAVAFPGSAICLTRSSAGTQLTGSLGWAFRSRWTENPPTRTASFVSKSQHVSEEDWLAPLLFGQKAINWRFRNCLGIEQHTGTDNSRHNSNWEPHRKFGPSGSDIIAPPASGKRPWRNFHFRVFDPALSTRDEISSIARTSQTRRAVHRSGF